LSQRELPLQIINLVHLIGDLFPKPFVLAPQALDLSDRIILRRD
jgi:hypothetical protein